MSTPVTHRSSATSAPGASAVGPRRPVWDDDEQGSGSPSGQRPARDRDNRVETAKRIAQERMRQRRRRILAFVILLATAGLVGLDLSRGGQHNAQPQAIGPTAGTGPAADASHTPALRAVIALAPTGAPTTPLDEKPNIPVTGPGKFRYAAGQGPMLGKAGTLRRFHVAVEDGMGQDVADFATAVEKILGDPRSWIASKQVRFQRVPKSTGAQFTVFLATSGTSEKMCAGGGLRTRKLTSCRLPGQVIINVARWVGAVPDYGAPLADYQAYAVNHEVGHQLGHGHEACPGPGRRAPVMQQQTYGLKGCRANAWPYLDGRRYAGPSIP